MIPNLQYDPDDVPDKPLMELEERDRLIAEMKVPEAWRRLHEIEQQIAESLMERPLRTWCRACFRMFRRIHEKATTEVTHATR
jgi:hypothetical protein